MIHQDLRHFRAGKLRGRRDAVAQHFTNGCSRQQYKILLRVIGRFPHHHDLVQLLGVSGVIRFEDLNCGDLTDWGVTQDDAARRLYVLKDGALLSGIPAFIALWQDMPRYARLARFVSIPGIYWLTVQFYDFMLAPILYRNHRKRLARAAES